MCKCGFTSEQHQIEKVRYMKAVAHKSRQRAQLKFGGPCASANCCSEYYAEGGFGPFVKVRRKPETFHGRLGPMD